MFSFNWILNKTLHLGIMASMMAVASGCSPSIEGLVVDKSFTYPALVAGKITVGGIVSIKADLDEAEQNSLSNVFTAQIIEEREKVTVVPHGQTANKLGPELLSKALGEYKVATLSEATIGEIRAKLDGIRYIIFTRLESDQIEKRRTDRKHTRDIKDSKGKTVRTIETGDKTVASKVTRQITATTDVFDLEQGIPVWSGQLTQSRTNTSEYEVKKDSGLVALVKAIKETENDPDKQYPYPTPPTEAKVLKLVFNGFSKNFPDD